MDATVLLSALFLAVGGAVGVRLILARLTSVEKRLKELERTGVLFAPPGTAAAQQRPSLRARMAAAEDVLKKRAVRGND